MTARSRKTAVGAVFTALAATFGVLLAVFGFAGSAQAATGLHVQDGRLVESTGDDFVIRGVSHAHAWYADQVGSLADIKEKGANTVRVVLSSGDQWERNDVADVTNIVSQCKENRLICVLEVHDTTGYGEDGAAISLDRAADYWISIQEALEGQEDHVIVNLGNEPHGNTGYESWAADTTGAIQKLRDAGFEHALMADAPNWGQDWQGVMRDNAQSVFDSDPLGNTVFSVHMYGVYDTAAEINDYLNAFVDAGLPIVVGEFGHNHSDGDPDEDTIMATTQELGIGYIGWSWSGNGGGVEYLDMVTNFDASQLTEWGERIFNGANGIAETAQEAAIYG